MAASDPNIDATWHAGFDPNIDKDDGVLVPTGCYKSTNNGNAHINSYSGAPFISFADSKPFGNSRKICKASEDSNTQVTVTTTTSVTTTTAPATTVATATIGAVADYKYEGCFDHDTKKFPDDGPKDKTQTQCMEHCKAKKKAFFAYTDPPDLLGPRSYDVGTCTCGNYLATAQK